jgi:hypothetical protein
MHTSETGICSNLKKIRGVGLSDTIGSQTQKQQQGKANDFHEQAQDHKGVVDIKFGCNTGYVRKSGTSHKNNGWK